MLVLYVSQVTPVISESYYNIAFAFCFPAAIFVRCDQ